MSYVIMNKGSLEGFQAGLFGSLFNLFYERALSDGRQKWADSISDACTFLTEQDAWYYAENVWGRHFASKHFLIVSVREPAMDKAHENRPRIEAHQEEQKRPAPMPVDMHLDRVVVEEELIEALHRADQATQKADEIRNKLEKMDALNRAAEELGYKLVKDN